MDISDPSPSPPVDLTKIKNQEDRRFLHQMVREANGLLPMAVYNALWHYAGKAAGPNFLEIGAAHGAGTIALALGARKAGLNLKLQTVDRLGGKFSSRTGFGDVDQNAAIVQQNFARAGVADGISLFVGSSDEFIAAKRCPERIDFLLLDADGRIDRDLLHFYDVLAPDALVVIDDVDSEVFLGTNSEGLHYVDLKHRITSLLLAAFVADGYLQVEQRIKWTAFCRRGDRTLDQPGVVQMALKCYRELVFADLPEPHWQELMEWHRQREPVRRALQSQSRATKVFASLAQFWKAAPKKTD